VLLDGAEAVVEIFACGHEMIHFGSQQGFQEFVD